MEKLESAIKRLKNDEYIEEKSYDYLLELGYDINLKTQKSK